MLYPGTIFRAPTKNLMDAIKVFLCCHKNLMIKGHGNGFIRLQIILLIRIINNIASINTRVIDEKHKQICMH